MFNYETWSQGWRDQLDISMTERFGDVWPMPFQTPLRYPLESGGKRIRPALTIAAFESIGRNNLRDAAMSAAAAVEMIHTYSLVHDDLPMLDDDDERRGNPTVHVAFDEPTALLVGDGLLTEAFSVLAEADAPAEVVVKLLRILSTAAGVLGMVGGQAADVGIGGKTTTMEELTHLHRLKTGALLKAAVGMGGVTAGATPEEEASLLAYAEAVGLAFQVTDDILDAEEDEGAEGPPAFPKLIGLEATKALAQEQLQLALSALEKIPNPETLAALARFIVNRSH